MKTLRNTLIKTVITVEDDLWKLEDNAEEELVDIVEELEVFFEPVTKELENILHPQELSFDLNQTKEEVKGTGKKEEAKKKEAPKKGGKDELAAYESNLPLPTSGIESLVLLLDTWFMDLPFEALNLFEGIPVLSRDFNLHLYTQRLTKLGHKADLHNNLNIPKENIKFIYDVPPLLQPQFESEIIAKHKNLIANSTWNGVYSKDHIPAKGEWERYLKDSSLFIYYSLTCLLHKFTPWMIADSTSISNSNCAVILDWMNTLKPFIEKDVLTSPHFMNHNQPTETAELLSILGLNTVLINQWPMWPEENYAIYKEILKEVGTEGVYLSAALRKYWEGTSEWVLVQKEGQADEVEEKITYKKALYRFNTISYGVPLTRVI